MPFISENKLEEALVRAVKSPATAPDFYRLLLESDLLVLGKALGVGVMSAALKKGLLDAAGYASMIATTTQLNKPGPELAEMPDVHGLTDVTRFGLAGHALELARGSGCDVHLDWARVPLLPGVAALVAQGLVTGASARNWAAYGADVKLPALPAEGAQALLSDPQTSGGLLLSCDPAAVDDVLAIFQRGHLYATAAFAGLVLYVAAIKLGAPADETAIGAVLVIFGLRIVARSRDWVVPQPVDVPIEIRKRRDAD